MVGKGPASTSGEGGALDRQTGGEDEQSSPPVSFCTAYRDSPDPFTRTRKQNPSEPAGKKVLYTREFMSYIDAS